MFGSVTWGTADAYTEGLCVFRGCALCTLQSQIAFVVACSVLWNVLQETVFEVEGIVFSNPVLIDCFQLSAGMLAIFNVLCILNFLANL